MATNKPTLKNGPASEYAGPNEVIREFSFGPRGKAHGGLLSMLTLDDGSLRIDVYNTDGPITVMGPGTLTREQVLELMTNAALVARNEDQIAQAQTRGDITEMLRDRFASEIAALPGPSKEATE